MKSCAEAVRNICRPRQTSRQQAAVEHHAWFRRQVQAGLDSADTGDLVPAGEVEAEAATWRAEIRSKMISPAS